MIRPHGKLLCVATALLLGFVWCQVLLSDENLPDDEKLRIVYEMYEDYKKSFPEVQDVTSQAAMRLMQSSRVVFVDVRGHKEQEVSMLPGAVTEKEFRENPDKYKDSILIGYCTISYRSGKLARKLRRDGIIMANLKGGMLAWVLEGGKVFDAQGETKRIHVYGKTWNYAPEAYEAFW